jgi:hypothetical protein
MIILGVVIILIALAIIIILFNKWDKEQFDAECSFWRTYQNTGGICMDKNDDVYLCFTENTTIADGAQRFIQKYQVEPKQTFVQFHMLWVGPVPQKQEPPVIIQPKTPAIDIQQLELDL